MTALPVASTNPRFAWQSGGFSFQCAADRSPQTVYGKTACGKPLYIAWQQGFFMAFRGLALNVADSLKNCIDSGFLEFFINKILKNKKKRKNIANE